MYTLSFIIFLFITQTINSQEPQPKWAKDPIPDGYFFGVGIGKTESEAVKKAKDDALIKSLPIIYQQSFHQGIIKIDSLRTIAQSDTKQRDYIAQTRAINSYGGKKVYVLLRYTNAKDKSYIHTDRVFEKKLNEWNDGIYSPSARAFVPGWAQIYKGNKMKGAIFIAAEVGLLVGVAVMEGQRSSNESKMKTTYDKRHYSDRMNKYRDLRNGFIISAAGVYIWNVIDGLSPKGKKRSNYLGNIDLKISPFAVPEIEGGGLTFAVNF